MPLCDRTGPRDGVVAGIGAEARQEGVQDGAVALERVSPGVQEVAAVGGQGVDPARGTAVR